MEELTDECDRLRVREKQLLADMKKRGDAARQMLLTKDAEIQAMRDKLQSGGVGGGGTGGSVGTGGGDGNTHISRTNSSSTSSSTSTSSSDVGATNTAGGIAGGRQSLSQSCSSDVMDEESVEVVEVRAVNVDTIVQ